MKFVLESCFIVVFVRGVWEIVVFGVWFWCDVVLGVLVGVWDVGCRVSRICW